MLLILSGCGGESATLRYKLIARANVGGEIIEAYAVNQLTVSTTPYSLSGNAASSDLTAEATILDMGERGSMFILQNVNNHPSAIVEAYDIAGSMGSLRKEGIEKFRTIQGQGRVSWPDRLIKPRMMAFRDESDPASIFEVTRENFSDHFGTDAKLIALYIEPTTEPISNVIPTRLPWWRRGGGAIVPLEKGGPSRLPLSQTISHSQFKRK